MKKVFWLGAACMYLSLISVADVTAAEGAEGKAGPVAEEMVATPSAASNVVGAEAEEHSYFDVFVNKFKQGGLTMVWLLALSVAGIGIILERTFNLRPSTFATLGLVERATVLYKGGKYEELQKVCREDKSILGRIVLAIVDHRECETNDIQNIANDIGSREIRIQLKKSYMLAIIATLSPLLGLFGTVIGMIGAFDTVAAVGEMGNAALMAADIAKALVTTAGGLIVAMPMLGFYHMFRTRTQGLAIGLEEDMSELFSAWFLKKKRK